jgi:hypothetical protein
MSSLMNNIDGISLSSKGVTSSSTCLHMNNLVEFYSPFRTSDHLTVSCKHARKLHANSFLSSQIIREGE